MNLNKRGAFLTLGMTFISIMILAVGSAILKNAQDSEERVFELGSMDRLYNMANSIQESYRTMYLGIFPFNYTGNQTEHSFSVAIPSPYVLPSDLYITDYAFIYFPSLYNASNTLIRGLYPSFNFTSSNTVFPNTNSTSIFTPEVNMSYTYLYTDSHIQPTTFSLSPNMPSQPTNGLIVYDQSSPASAEIESYKIILKNPLIDGNVSWDYYTAGLTELTVEYYGPNDNSTDTKSISFLDISGNPDDLAQIIRINTSTPSTSMPWPQISINTANGGPFKDKGQMFIAPYAYNFTATVTVNYAIPLPRNITFYTYDSFNLTSQDLGIGKYSFYRIV